MFTLHCTARLRDRLRRPLAEHRQPATTMLGDWYATALFWKPQLALLVNERTLLPVILPLAPADSLLERIGPAVALVLARHGVEPRLIETEVTAMAQAEIAKTANRSVVGTMNEFAFEARVYRDHRGTTDPVELSMRLAETPCGAIRYDGPSRLLRTLTGVLALSVEGCAKGLRAGGRRLSSEVVTGACRPHPVARHAYRDRRQSQRDLSLIQLALCRPGPTNCEAGRALCAGNTDLCGNAAAN